eukprot:1184284-Prorocentrum_minimum.AAC.2
MLGATGVSRHFTTFAPVASAGGLYRGLREGCVQHHYAMCAAAWAVLNAVGEVMRTTQGRVMQL